MSLNNPDDVAGALWGAVILMLLVFAIFALMGEDPGGAPPAPAPATTTTGTMPPEEPGG